MLPPGEKMVLKISCSRWAWEGGKKEQRDGGNIKKDLSYSVQFS